MSGVTVEPDWPTVVVTPWERTAAVAWRDGKPRCAKHGTCLVTRYAIHLHGPGHHCAQCMREFWESGPKEQEA